jgi:hypothetical protein
MECREVDFVVDQVAESVFETAGQDLAGKGDGDERWLCW